MKPGSRRALRVGALVVLLVATVLTPFQPGRAAARVSTNPLASGFPTLPQSPLWPSAPPAGPAVRTAATRPQTTLQPQTARSRQAASPVGHKARAASRAAGAALYDALPLSFERNDGQVDPQVAYLAHGPGYSVFLTASGAVLSLATPRQGDGPQSPTGARDLAVRDGLPAPGLAIAAVGAAALGAAALGTPVP